MDTRNCMSIRRSSMPRLAPLLVIRLPSQMGLVMAPLPLLPRLRCLELVGLVVSSLQCEVHPCWSGLAWPTGLLVLDSRFKPQVVNRVFVLSLILSLILSSSAAVLQISSINFNACFLLCFPYLPLHLHKLSQISFVSHSLVLSLLSKSFDSLHFFFNARENFCFNVLFLHFCSVRVKTQLH